VIEGVMEEMNNKMYPVKDGIKAEIYKLNFKIFPKSIKAMYNGYLENGIFPDRWKKAKINPIMKPGTQKWKEVNKYRPIIFLNVGGKILERVLKNRINHYIYSTEFLNKNHYGFILQTSTTDAIMNLKFLLRKDLEKVKSQQL